MSHITVGRVVNTQSNEERISVELSESELNVGEAEELIERVQEQLALMNGATVAAETPATDEIDVDEHPPESMMGSPEYHTKDGEESGESAEDDDPDGEGGDMVACTECDREFDTDHGMKIHRGRSHSDNGSDDSESVECVEDGCEREFDSDRAMNIHRGRSHGSSEDRPPRPAGGDEDEDEQSADVDGGDDEGDVVQEQDGSDLPFGCPVVGCEKRFDNRDDRRTHRDNAHTETEVMRGYREKCREQLPDDVEIVAIERAAAASSSVHGVADELDIEKAKARKWTNMLQLTDALNEHSETQAVHMIEDVHEELDIDEPTPAVPGGEAA